MRSLVIAFCLALTGCGDFLHVAALRSQVFDKVVYVYTNPNEKSGGTGFHVKGKSGQTVLMTNNHICEGAKNGMLFVKGELSPRAIPRRVLEMSKEGDACIVEPLPGVEGLTLSKNEVEDGNHYHVFGHPLLYPLAHSAGEYLQSLLIEILHHEMLDPNDGSCKGPRQRVESYMTWLGPVSVCIQSEPSEQLSIQIYPGNSGSPLLNDSGEVVGIMFASQRGTIFSFAVPLPVLRNLLEMY